MNRKIDRREFVKTSSVGLAGLGLTSHKGFSISTSKTRKAPNILFLFTDQQHIDSISALGCDYVKTPGMDRIAQSGTSFTESYCPSPVCGPCRASVYTGRTPAEVGVIANSHRPVKGIPFMGEWFRDSGYETLYMGKWHVPQYTSSRIPGFNVVFCGPGGPGSFADNSYTFAADAYLRNYRGSKPFLMAINYMQPHDICEWLRINRLRLDELPFPEIEGELPPLPDNFEYPEQEAQLVKDRRVRNENVTGEWDELHWRYYFWAYYRHVEMVDAEVNRVMNALESANLRKNTLVVFSSDHGEGMGHHQMVRKSILYDEAAKVPLIFSLPGQIESNVVNKSDLVTLTDLMPTFCDFAGIDAPPKMRGYSLKKTLTSGHKLKRDFVTSEIETNRGQMIRTRNYKYIAYLNDPNKQLFHVKDDPGETQNVINSKKHRSAFTDHKELHKDWIKSLDIPENLENRWYVS